MKVIFNLEDYLETMKSNFEFHSGIVASLHIFVEMFPPNLSINKNRKPRRLRYHQGYPQ